MMYRSSPSRLSSQPARETHGVGVSHVMNWVTFIWSLTAGRASGPGRWRALRLQQIAVPEPTSLSLLELGGMASLRRAR